MEAVGICRPLSLIFFDLQRSKDCLGQCVWQGLPAGKTVSIGESMSTHPFMSAIFTLIYDFVYKYKNVLIYFSQINSNFSLKKGSFVSFHFFPVDAGTV